MPASALSVGALVDIPARDGGLALKYTVLSGDSYWGIANAVGQCAGITSSDIQAANPGVNPNTLQIGQVIQIPAKVATTGTTPSTTSPSQPATSSGVVAFWRWTWSSSSTPPVGTQISLAFSGWTDPDTALANSQRFLGKMPGANYLCLGGGTKDGSFTAASLQTVTAAIQAGKFKGWAGIAYDVEGGDSGLANLFAQSFSVVKKAGFAVLVTVSHSQPYDISDAATLMKAFFSDANIDYLSPQLYTTGNETANDYTAIGTKWSQYATAKAKIIPSIVKASYYQDAVNYFATQGVQLAGFVQWSQSA
jgi:hypothetical protein